MTESLESKPAATVAHTRPQVAHRDQVGECVSVFRVPPTHTSLKPANPPPKQSLVPTLETTAPLDRPHCPKAGKIAGYDDDNPPLTVTRLASVSASFASLPSASCRSRSASSHSPIFMWHTASPLCSSGCVCQPKKQGQDIRDSHVSTTPKACGRLQARCAAAAA